MDNLEEFLKGGEAPEAEVVETAEAPEAVETPVAEEPKGPARDEKGRFAPKGDNEPEAQQDAPPASEEPQFEHAAVIGERRRRQEAEARIAALEQQIAQFQKPQPAPQEQASPQGPPDRWEDPEGYDRWLVGQAAQAARAEAMQTFQYQRIETSAVAFKATVPDYDEKIATFGQMLQANPGLLNELYRSPEPAKYAYNMAKTQLEISQYGGIDGLINARIEEALKQQAPAPATPPIPDTLADAQSARGVTAEGIHVPTLDEILKR